MCYSVLIAAVNSAIHSDHYPRFLLRQENRSLKRVDLAWNGFGFEGCVALSDALARNYVIEDLDISSNRINPPALMELVRGLALNKTLQAIRVSEWPSTRLYRLSG